MGDIYRYYYDVVRLSHHHEKVLRQKDCHFVISSEASTLQRSRSSEDHLHDIFVIDTAAAVPDKLLDTIHHSDTGKLSNRERILSIIRSQRFGRRRRSKSYTEVVRRRSSIDLFELRTKEKLIMTDPCEQIDDGTRTSSTNGMAVGGGMNMFGYMGDAQEDDCEKHGTVRKSNNGMVEGSIMTIYGGKGEQEKEDCETDNNARRSSNGIKEESNMTIYGHTGDPERGTKAEETDGVFEEAKEAVDSFEHGIIARSPAKSHDITGKTRIISCQSDDSAGFEESRKFLSDSDLTQDPGDNDTNCKQRRSSSLEKISKLLDTEDKGDRQETCEMENSGNEEQISAICSAYRSKDSIISKLEQELKESFKLLSEKEAEVKAICAEKDGDGWEKYTEKEEENIKLRKEMIELKAECSRLHALYHQTVTSLEKTKTDVSRLKYELEEREKYHEKTYLKMYEKGQKAALIEREQQLEELASQNPQSVSTQELLDKLNHTQSELGRWQTLARQESYEAAASNKPRTESEATLQFMKDCMFHYLTDKEDCGVHLRAMVRMLGFTDKEKRKMIQLRRKVKKNSAEYFSGVLLNP